MGKNHKNRHEFLGNMQAYEQMMVYVLDRLGYMIGYDKTYGPVVQETIKEGPKEFLFQGNIAQSKNNSS